MSRKTHHMSVNIEGMLQQCKRRKINFMQYDDGSSMTDTEARAYVAECQAKRWKLLPTGECIGFDPFGKGCPGHPVPTAEELEQKKSPKGGYSKAQLAEWNIPWPPPKGWKQKLLDKWNK